MPRASWAVIPTLYLTYLNTGEQLLNGELLSAHQRKPIILFGTKYWQGMVKWVEDVMLGDEKNISPDDLRYLKMTDSPEEAVNFINEFYKSHLLRPNF